MTQKFEINADEAGIRLDRWFRRKFPGTPQSLLQKSLRKGDIRVDGKKAEANTRLLAGQNVTVSYFNFKPADKPYKPKIDEKKAEMLKSSVIYKDDDIIAINKPAGLAAQGGTKVGNSVDSLLDALIFEANERPKLVHRIDKDTSGVMILARNTKAASLLTAMFKDKTITKKYWAVVVGTPHPQEGTIKKPIIAKKLVKRAGRKIEKADVDEFGQSATTIYRTLDVAAKKAALVELQPITGRMHQLRVHMSFINHPILGDGKYGGKFAFIPGLSERMHLHAHEVVINLKGKKIKITAPLPFHMQETFDKLGFQAFSI